MGDKPEEIFIVENSDQPLIAPQKIMQISGTTQVNLENVQDFSNVCRTCATITDFVIPIFSGEGLQNNLAEKIKKHLPIQVSESDALPLVVCYQCASTLLAWHELVQCTLQADAALKARLERDAKDPKPTSTNITLTIEEKSPSTVPAAELTPATPSPSQAPQYSESRSYCLLCNTWHEATDLEKHVFHCSECNRYLHRSEFMTHVADHAMHHNKKPTKRRKIKKKKSCESNNKTETPSSRPNQEKTHERMEDEFSDHSDVEFVFGPLPQSVFEAIEDSQDSQLVPDEMQSPANDTVTDVDQATEPMTTLEVENLEETIEPLPQVLETIPQSETIPLTKTSPSKTQHILNTDKTLTQSPTTPENESNSLPSTQVTEHAETKLPSPNTTKSVQDNKKARTCSQCSKVYTASSSYFYHIKYAHSTKKESCNICNKKFISKENLSQHHAAVHKREYRFECQECKKRFRSNASLYIHKQTHYSVKTWACSLCDRTFRWRTEMNRHMKRHAAEKSYVCETCGRGFSVRYDLVRHAKTHAAGSFVCDKCGQKFAQQRYLKVHMENKHS